MKNIKEKTYDTHDTKPAGKIDKKQAEQLLKDLMKSGA
jgi:hypothetical protein